MKLTALVAATVLLAGCGGGGSDTPVIPATTFPALQIGDIWNYNVSLNLGPDFGTHPGTLVESVTSDTYNGQPSMRQTSAFAIQNGTGTDNISSYVEYSLSGQLLAIYTDGALSAVTSDTFHVPTPLSSATKASGTVTLSSGETLAYTYEIVGKSQVSTPAGSYSCWVVYQTIVRSDGSRDDYNLWIAPETGNYVKATDHTVNPDGSTYTYLIDLTSNTLASPNSKMAPKEIMPLLAISGEPQFSHLPSEILLPSH